MAFLKDIQDKIILGRWRFLNLRPLESDNLQSLAIDENGNLGIGTDTSGEIGELTERVSNLEDEVSDVSEVADSALQPGDSIPSSNITGLGTAATADADDFLPSDYTPEWDDIDNKPATFPPSTHTHTIAQVDGLQDELDSKQDVGDYATTTALTSGLAGKADTVHTHTQSQITGLVDDLAAKLTASQGSAIADAVDDTDIVDQFNALLAALRTAGIIAE